MSLLNGRVTSPRGVHVDEIRKKDKKETGYGQIWARDASHPLVQKVRLSTFKLWAICVANAMAKLDFTFEASLNELAAKTGLHKRTVGKGLEQLRAIGMIETKHNWGTHPGWQRPGWKRTHFKVLRVPEGLSDQDLTRVLVLPRKGPYADDAPLSVSIWGARERRLWARERARAEAEAAARATTLNLRASVERVFSSAVKLGEQIEGWPEVPRPTGEGRFVAPEVVGEAWTARALVQAARRTLWDTWTQLLWVMARLGADVELAAGESWAGVYSGTRILIELGAALAAVVERAEAAVQTTRAGWMALVSHPDAATPGRLQDALTADDDDDDDDDDSLQDDELPPRLGEPWRPPRRWDPADGNRSAAAWEAAATEYRRASELDGRLGEKIRIALMRQGFRADWPEPGLSAMFAASGRGPPTRRR